MKCLIVEDDFAARRLLQRYLSSHRDCDIAVDGNEAVEAFRQATDEKEPYDLICLDIMMPNMNGHEALKAIRQIESEHGKQNEQDGTQTLAEWQQAAWYDIFPAVLPFPERVC